MEAISDKTLDCVLNLSIGEKRSLYRYLSAFMTMQCSDLDIFQAEKVMRVVSEVTGYNPSTKTRRCEDVYARYMVAYQLMLEGYRQSEIARYLGLEHATVVHGVKYMEEVICYHYRHKQEFGLWKQVQKKLMGMRNE